MPDPSNHPNPPPAAAVDPRRPLVDVLLHHATTRASPGHQMLLLRLTSLVLHQPVALPASHIRRRWVLIGGGWQLQSWLRQHHPAAAVETIQITTPFDARVHLTAADCRDLVFIELPSARPETVNSVGRMRTARAGAGPWVWWSPVDGYHGITA